MTPCVRIVVGALAVGCGMVALAETEALDWPAVMRPHAMTFDRLPQSWSEAPHFGNAMVGSMLYQEGDAIKLQVFRANVHDHRDQSDGWTAYSRPRLQIGHFLLHPVGKLKGCEWRKDLWDAELTGVIQTDKGEIVIRHLVHADDMAIMTELTPTAGERACHWTWHPMEAKTTRAGTPVDQASFDKFVRKYGGHYQDSLKIYQPNPPGRQEKRGDVQVWIQDFLVGGQYATAWSEQQGEHTRTHIVSIAHTHPDSTAADMAVAEVGRCLMHDRKAWVKRHRQWWHGYYPQSFVSIPDADLESLYWQTIYRLGCTSRSGRSMVDTAGLWFQGMSWPYYTSDWNIQSAHWPVYTANRLDQGQALVDRLHEKRQALIDGVLPKEWREDSAYMALAVAWDMVGSINDDQRYDDLFGNLPWAMHNAWLQYRYSMNDEMLREKVFPLLRRSINLYLHLVKESPDGHLRLPATYSPETGIWDDCNFDLALFKWGCHTLLSSCERLNIDDPLIPRWKEVIKRLPDYPADEHGYMLGSNKTSSPNHQHFSNLLMIHPLYLVNIEQGGGEDVMKRSFHRALGTAGPGDRQAMVQAHAGPIGAALGLGDETLKSLELLQGDLYPNGLWYQSPCIESTLAAANIIQDMMLQSWSDPAAVVAGPIRVFPAMPSTWEDAEFRDFRTEGAFLVSATRVGGKTTWVKIKSLAGEPCRVRLGMKSPKISGKRTFQMKSVGAGVIEVELKKGEEVVFRR